MQLFRDLKHDSFVKLLFALFVILSEHFDQEGISALLEVVDRAINALLICRVENGQQKIHQEEQSNYEVHNKESGIPSLLAVRGQHHIWIVGSCQEHKHVEEGVVQIGESFNAFDGACEETAAHPRKVKYVDDNEEDHWGRALDD